MLFKNASNYIHTQQQTVCNTMLDTAAPLYKRFLQEMLLRPPAIANTKPSVGHNCVTMRIILVANAVNPLTLNDL